MLTFFGLLFNYILVGLIVRSYFKVYRWDGIFEPDLVAITIIWPFYILYRMIGWAFGKVTKLIDRKMFSFKNRPKKLEKKVRVSVDRELVEAEYEVEEMLASRK